MTDSASAVADTSKEMVVVGREGVYADRIPLLSS